MSESQADDWSPYEELECYDCHATLEWEGELPENEWSALCYDCAILRLEARVRYLEKFKHTCEEFVEKNDLDELAIYIEDERDES